MNLKSKPNNKFKLCVFLCFTIPLSLYFYMSRIQTKPQIIQTVTTNFIRTRYRRCSDYSFPEVYWDFNRSKSNDIPWDMSDIAGSTDAKNTLVDFDKSRSYTVGNNFVATIVAKDFRNQLKKIGGDFFHVVLLRKSVDGDGVAGKITDHGNGNYTIHAPLLWEGKTKLQIVLLHSSEAVKALILKTSEENGDGFGFISVTDKRNYGKFNRTMLCGPFPPTKDSNICDLSNPTYGEPWFCEKPKEGCDQLISYNTDKFSFGIWKWKCEWVDYLNKRKTWAIKIAGSGKVFKIGKSDTLTNDKKILPACGISKPTSMNVEGWFLNSKWRSSFCNNRQYSVEFAKSCLENTDIHIFGDSTSRQFFQFLTDSLDLPQSPIEDLEYKGYTHLPSKNITVFFTIHGAPFHKLADYSVRPYVSNSLTKIAATQKQTFILISMGLHFLSYRPSFFRQRLNSIKNAILKLQIRIPDVKIVFKSINFHDEPRNNPLLRPQWILHRLNIIIREVFQDIPYVFFVSTWDMTLVQTPDDVHPNDEMLSQQLGLIFSYLCPYLT